jgi:hypothetical protein
MDVAGGPELDMLFDLFNEDFCEEMERGVSDSVYDDNGDDTSSESSGSSGRSSLTSTSASVYSLSTTTPHSTKHISTYYPSPPTVMFAPNPLSSFVSAEDGGGADDSCNSSKKRTKTEEKLMRNRESANKSRLKRKHEKLQLEETVAELREKVRTLEMENNALLTDNTTLSQHNFFLQSMLKKQQDGGGDSSCLKSESAASQSQMSALSGISMLCVVFSISFFNDWLPSSLQGPADNADDDWRLAESSTGRVLLSADDDDYSGGAYVSLLDGPQQPLVAVHYVIIVSAMFAYYCYIQRSKAAEKKSNRLLPS